MTPTEAGRRLLAEIFIALRFPQICNWINNHKPESKLDFLNRFILRWFFIRLCTGEDRIPIYTDVDLRLDPLPAVYEQVTRAWYIMAWVVPTSGYGNAFRYIGPKWFWRVSRFTVSVERLMPPVNHWNCRCTLTPNIPSK